MYGNNYEHDSSDTSENEDITAYRNITMDSLKQNGTVYNMNTTNFFFNLSNIYCSKNKNIDQSCIEPEYFECSFAVSYPLSALVNPRVMCNVIEQSLKHFEHQELIDWCQEKENLFIFDGRIFHHNDDAEFRCQIYSLKQDAKRSMLELRRMGGDAFVFARFREKLVHYLTEQKYLNNDNNNEDNVDDESSQSSQSPVSVESSNDIAMRFDFENVLNFNIFENVENNDYDHYNLKNVPKEKIHVERAKNLVLNVKDRSCYGEIFRDNILTLRHVVDDDEDSKILGQLETIFEDLLSPIIWTDSNPLMDCWAIKTLLEIVLILLPKSKSTCSKENIISIREKWENPVQHPLGIVAFMPSQQICRLCDKCLKALQERERKNIY